MPSSTLYVVKAWKSQEETKTFWQRIRVQLFASALGLTEKGLNELVDSELTSKEMFDLYSVTLNVEGNLLFQSGDKKNKNIFLSSFATALIGSRLNLFKLPLIFISLAIELLVSFFREGALSLNIVWDKLRENYFAPWVLGKFLFFMPAQILANIFAYFFHTINRPNNSFANYKSFFLGLTLVASAITVLGTGYFDLLAYFPTFAQTVSVIGLGTGLVAVCLGIILYSASLFGQTVGLCHEIYEWAQAPAPPLAVTKSAATSVSANHHHNTSTTAAVSGSSQVFAPSWTTPAAQIEQNKIGYLYGMGIEALQEKKVDVARLHFQQIAGLCTESHLKSALQVLINNIKTATFPANWQAFIDANPQTSTVVVASGLTS